MRVTTQEDGERYEVIPLHDPIRAKTLSSILKSIARHHGIGAEELLRTLGLCYRAGQPPRRAPLKPGEDRVQA